MVNHTRSLIGIDDPYDGNRVRPSGSSRRSRSPRWSRTYQTAPATRPPFVMVGDLNAYEFTDGYVDVVGQIAGDAVAADNLTLRPNLINPDLTKQALNAPAANDRYSYVYGGHGPGPRPRPDHPGYQPLGPRASSSGAATPTPR